MVIELKPSPGPSTAPASPEVFDITIKHPLTRRIAGLYGVMFVLMLALCMFIIIQLGPSPSSQVIGMLPFVVFLSLLIWITRRMAQRRVRASLHRAWMDQLPETTEAILRSTRNIQPMAALHELCRCAGQAGVRNKAIRIGQSKHLEQLAPIEVQFEPQRLDETDPALLHLADDIELVPDEHTDTTWLWIKRNIQVKGGWLVAIAFGFNVLLYVAKSWQDGRVSWELAMWSAMFLSVLLLPVGGFGSRKQLLAVPGGLCHRRIRRGSDDWNIHLFTRESSVACIYQSGARQWMIVVADEQEHAKCAGTRKEVEFALRAWLSPLDPPTIDQLKELA